MSTNHTPNYGLSQWEKTDKVLMEDFNADNSKIDTALAALAAKVPASNLSCYAASYKGVGGQSKSFSFSGKPWLVLILNEYGFGTMAVRNCPHGCVIVWGASSNSTVSSSWYDSGVTVQSTGGNINESGRNFWVFALLES